MELWEPLALRRVWFLVEQFWFVLSTFAGPLESGRVRISVVVGVCIDYTLVIFMVLGHDNSNTLHW